MADDIVTRLEREIELSDTCICNWMLEDAVDEIKRLRVELEEAYDACRYALAHSPRWQENCATVIATWEARRG